MSIKNAKITSAFLGYEDHGILTVCLTLALDSYTVIFGGMALSSIHGYTPLFGKYISEILLTVGVSEWKDLVGKYVRVEESGIGSPVTKIGNIIEDTWLDNSAFFRSVEE